MNSDKDKFALLNFCIKLTNINDQVVSENGRKRKKYHADSDYKHDCFRIELSKPISLRPESMNLKSVFDSSNPAKKHVSSVNSGKLFHADTNLPSIFKINLSHMNLMKKENLLCLIEKNFSNGIKCPFDLFAYTRLCKIPCSGFDQKQNSYNWSTVRKISKMFPSYQINPLDTKFLQNNPLLACSAGAFLMPFYFDIFSIRELNEFSPIEIDMIVDLKKKYPTHVHLNYDSMISNYKDDILWNCLYNFNDLKKFGSNRHEFFNYFLAMMYTLYHLEYVVNHIQRQPNYEKNILRIHFTKVLELSEMIPFLFEAYILTGLFTHADYIHYERFVIDKLKLKIKKNEYKKIESVYYENTLNMIRQTSGKVFPLKLSNLCRISIKNCMNDFNQKNILERFIQHNEGIQ
ncbi:hypothetical protein BpHYR1_017284 [Brachionus plicatilis]|uniref:Uncharacterized protein n=1 Tax=Brachionus plicatilis TaxID=10195 RepID=A0A3M7P9P7_BRAPC|nr:hypothetical protein BpHYR1_017284 [Brachionus plicatilis]